MDFTDILIAAAGIALGGFIKGATGAGAPVVGVPVLTMVIGIQNTVAIFAVLNLFSNIWQAWTYRAAVSDKRFLLRFALAGAAGAIPGSLLLAWLPTDFLMAGLALVVFLYIGIRLARPSVRLARSRAGRLAAPVGFLGGMMQGAGGISAPISVTFLNAMRLERPEFIGTIAGFFMAMSVTQVPSLIAVGLLDWERAGLACLAALPLFGAMPLGAAAARHISKDTFDKVVLALLAVVALRLMYVALN